MRRKQNNYKNSAPTQAHILVKIDFKESYPKHLILGISSMKKLFTLIPSSSLPSNYFFLPLHPLPCFLPLYVPEI